MLPVTVARGRKGYTVFFFRMFSLQYRTHKYEILRLFSPNITLKLTACWKRPVLFRLPYGQVFGMLREQATVNRQPSRRSPRLPRSSVSSEVTKTGEQGVLQVLRLAQIIFRRDLIGY